MADTGIFATTAEVQAKVGANASSVSNVESFINDYMTQAESFINVLIRINFSDLYSALNVDIKGILKRAASCLAAIDVLNYDLSGIPTRIESETRLDVLTDEANKALSLLKGKKQSTFMSNA